MLSTMLLIFLLNIINICQSQLILTEQSSFSIIGSYSSGSCSNDCQVMAVADDGSLITSLPEGTIVGGLFISTNSGSSWKSRLYGKRIKSVTVSSNGEYLAAAAFEDYIYLSYDYGHTWTSTFNDEIYAWKGICSSADGQIIIATTADDAHLNDLVIYTSNRGNTWSISSDQLTYARYLSCSSDGLQVIATDATNGDVYKSTDSGATWSTLLLPPPNMKNVASNPDGTILAATAGLNVYISTDSGNSWMMKLQTQYLVLSIAMSVDGSIIHASASNVGDPGIYSSFDRGSNWNRVSTGVPNIWDSLSCSSDGLTLLAPDAQGRVYIGYYSYASHSPTNIGDTLPPITSVPSQPTMTPFGRRRLTPAPTKTPLAPSFEPTSTDTPISSPTFIPTILPSASPTTIVPSFKPSVKPSCNPSASPTIIPSVKPSTQPTFLPSVHPSVFPTNPPSIYPSTNPSTSEPTPTKSSQPSSAIPSSNPTCFPSNRPSIQPSYVPTIIPTSIPTIHPSYLPSSLPIFNPTCIPTTTPSNDPTSNPTNNPSIFPTYTPSAMPSFIPTFLPTVQPSKPTGQPTSQPTYIDMKAVQFTISQNMKGITTEKFNKASVTKAYKNAVTNTLDLTLLQMTIYLVKDATVSIQATENTGISVIFFLNYYTKSIPSRDQIYKKLTSSDLIRLFKSNLNEVDEGAIANSIEVLNPNVNVIFVKPPTFTPTSNPSTYTELYSQPKSDKIPQNENLLGLIGLVVLCPILIALIYGWYRCRRGGDSESKNIIIAQLDSYDLDDSQIHKDYQHKAAKIIL